MKRTCFRTVALVCTLASADGALAADQLVYPDGRPAVARYRLEAKDQGRVLRHGNGPNQCDMLGARDVWAYESGGTYYMNYDGSGPKGWLTCLATSTDLVHWTNKGPMLDFGKPGEYCDAVWVYWSKDLNKWDRQHKAVVLDGKNCTWSKKCIGMPSVIPFKGKLAILYDAPGGDSKSHMNRDVGLAWLDLPLVPPVVE